MLFINQYSLGALDGFLRGISFIKPEKNGVDLCAGEFPHASQTEWQSFFSTLFSSQLRISHYSENQISTQGLRDELLKIISQIMLFDTFNHFAMTLQTRLMETIEEVVVDENGEQLFWAAWKEMDILEVAIDFSGGSSNRYFIFHLKDKSFFILIMKNA